MHAIRAVGVFVLISTLSLPSFAQMVPTTATKAMLEAHPGLRAMVVGERLVALYGVPCATDSDPLTTTDDFIASFLAVQANMDAMGVDDCEIEPVDQPMDQITIRSGKFTVYTYRQLIEGLPVHGSVVKIPELLRGAVAIR